MWVLCLKRDQKVATFWQKIATCKKQPHWRNMSQFSALIKCISNAIALYINKQVSQLNQSKFDLTFEFCCLSSQICFFFICHFFQLSSFSKKTKQIQVPEAKISCWEMQNISARVRSQFWFVSWHSNSQWRLSSSAVVRRDRSAQLKNWITDKKWSKIRHKNHILLFA